MNKITETPQQAAIRLGTHLISGGYQFECLHEYTDLNGNLLYWKIRFKHSVSGEKSILPLSLNENGYALREPKFQNTKPLYRLNYLSLHTDDVIIVCEGEKCVDELIKINALATTSGGAKSGANADWSPLAKRTVFLWPDNDPAGKKYMKTVANKLQALDCKIKLIDIDALQLPEKGDAVDWLAIHPNATVDDIFRLSLLDSHNLIAEDNNERGTDALIGISLMDFLAHKFKPRELLLSPWLPEQGLAMIYAKRGVGKTFVGLNIAYAISSAGEYLGWKAKKPCAVLYIDGEMPASVMQQRLEGIVAANDREASKFIILTPDMQKYGMPDLSTVQGQQILDPFTEKADVIIVDNISTLCRNPNENEAESWIPVQEWALRLRTQGKSVVFIHHASKNGGQRGTSKREDVLDTVIVLKHPSDYNPMDGAKFEIHFEKSRGFSGKDAEPLLASLIIDQDHKQQWTVQTIENSTYQQVIKLNAEGLKPSEIAEQLDIHKSTVSRHLRKAKTQELDNAEF